jgi:hypothetical protein
MTIIRILHELWFSYEQPLTSRKQEVLYVTVGWTQESHLHSVHWRLLHNNNNNNSVSCSLFVKVLDNIRNAN